MRKVNIFISSTCYDLSQIRADLKESIINMGHNPILSEEHDFPINPNLSNVENCINAVKTEADIFVLIIGNRYGCTLETGKSITNTEFLTAVEKGIPIYTFTLKEMLSILPIWEKNIDADFSSIVDNNSIFQFLQDVRKNSGLWNFSFERAQDIIMTLKSQLSNLFNDSLQIRYKVKKAGHNELYSKISGKALEFILNKEGAYETKFLMQCMCDEINKYKNLKNDYIYSIIIKSAYKIDRITEYTDWTLLKTGQIQNIIASLNGLMTNAFPVFYAEPGVPSDLDGLYYTAQTYGKLYAALLEWSIEVRSLIVPEELKESLMVLSKMPEMVINQVEAYPFDCLDKIYSAESDKSVNVGDKTVTLTLTLSIGDDFMERHSYTLSKLEQLASLGKLDL